MYKAVTYVKEHYGNPIVILSENGKNWLIPFFLIATYDPKFRYVYSCDPVCPSNGPTVEDDALGITELDYPTFNPLGHVLQKGGLMW